MFLQTGKFTCHFLTVIWSFPINGNEQFHEKPADPHKDRANTKQTKKDPQKKYRLGKVSKIFYWRA